MVAKNAIYIRFLAFLYTYFFKKSLFKLGFRERLECKLFMYWRNFCESYRISLCGHFFKSSSLCSAFTTLLLVHSGMHVGSRCLISLGQTFRHAVGGFLRWFDDQMDNGARKRALQWYLIHQNVVRTCLWTKKSIYNSVFLHVGQFRKLEKIKKSKKKFGIFGLIFSPWTMERFSELLVVSKGAVSI